MIRTSFCGYLNQIKQSGVEKNDVSFFFRKKGYHTISIYEKCMTSIFVDGDNKVFSKLKLPQNFFVFFFNR